MCKDMNEKRFEVEEQLVQSRAEQLVLQQSRRENGGEPKQPAAAAPTAEMKEKPKHGSTNQPTADASLPHVSLVLIPADGA